MGSSNVRMKLEIGSFSEVLLSKTNTAQATAKNRKRDTPTSALPIVQGLSSGGSLLAAGSTVSIIVRRIGSPHSGQLESAESDFKSYPHRTHANWRIKIMSFNCETIGDCDSGCIFTCVSCCVAPVGCILVTFNEEDTPSSTSRIAT